MNIRVPAALAERLGGPGPALDRRALGALAVAAYQAGEITQFALRGLPGFETRVDRDRFLRSRGVYEAVTLEDVRRDVAEVRASTA